MTNLTERLEQHLQSIREADEIIKVPSLKKFIKNGHYSKDFEYHLNSFILNPLISGISLKNYEKHLKNKDSYIPLLKESVKTCIFIVKKELKENPSDLNEFGDLNKDNIYQYAQFFGLEDDPDSEMPEPSAVWYEGDQGSIKDELDKHLGGKIADQIDNLIDDYLEGLDKTWENSSLIKNLYKQLYR